MATLSDHEVASELVSLMKDSGREQQAEELTAVMAALDSAEEQYSVLLSMMRNARKQLAETSEQGYSATEQVSAQVLQEEIEQILSQFAAAKEKVIIWSSTTMDHCKQAGVPALDADFSNLDAQKLLSEIHDQVENSTAKVLASLQQTDSKRAAVLSFLIASCISPSKLEQIVSKTVDIVGQTRENDMKPSIWKRLGQKKGEIAARSMPKPARNRKGAER